MQDVDIYFPCFFLFELNVFYFFFFLSVALCDKLRPKCDVRFLEPQLKMQEKCTVVRSNAKQFNISLVWMFRV